jgi:hypothetical protein
VDRWWQRIILRPRLSSRTKTLWTFGTWRVEYIHIRPAIRCNARPIDPAINCRARDFNGHSRAPAYLVESHRIGSIRKCPSRRSQNSAVLSWSPCKLVIIIFGFWPLLWPFPTKPGARATNKQKQSEANGAVDLLRPRLSSYLYPFSPLWSTLSRRRAHHQLSELRVRRPSRSTRSSCCGWCL